MLPIIYITDCRDDNTKARLAARIYSLIPESQVHFIGVTTDIEAAGNLVDALDALAGTKALIFINVAPRQGYAKKWENGTPFGHFTFNNTNIFTTIDGVCTSLLKKLTGQPQSISVFDIPSAVPYFNISKEEEVKIINTQFRSLEFLPRVAAAILANTNIPTTEFTHIQEVGHCVWWVDSFGNVKTTLLPETVGFSAHKKVTMELMPPTMSESLVMAPSAGIKKPGKDNVISLYCYERLKDVPNGELGLIIGSSGIQNNRLLEIVQQGKPVASILEIAVGTEITVLPSEES